MSPKRGAYPREFRDEAIRLLRAGRDLHELARELGVTPGTLRVWLHVADGGRHGPDLSRDAVINATVAAFRRLDDVLGVVRPSALETPMLFASESIDAWRIKDAVAHVTHYKARAVHRLIKGRAKEVPERDLDGYWAPEEWAALEAADHVLPRLDARTRRRHGLNHLVYERWRDRSAREVLAWHRRVHEHVVSVLRDGPDEWFGPSGRLPRVAVGELAHHLDTHLRDIRRALS
jgi:hypothetical protein